MGAIATVRKIRKFVKRRKKCSNRKTVVKTVLATTAVLAFVPTIVKINKGEGFDAYGLLSHVKYEKHTDETGKLRKSIKINLIDLERYGIKSKKAENAEELCQAVAETAAEEAAEDNIMPVEEISE